MRFKHVPYPGLIAIVFLTGCGNNPLGREPIQGTITLRGVPLDQGAIEFRPVEKKGGVSSGAVITNGEYSVPTEKGLPPGRYRVMIFSAAADPSPAPSGPPGSSPMGGPRPTIERIPPQYNVASEIIAEVTDGGENRFDYKIE
jgi:hypothetical protein